MARKRKSNVSPKDLTGIQRNEYYTIKDLRNALKVGRTTIWRWIKTEGFPRPIQVGKRPRWTKEQVDNWLHSRPRGVGPMPKSLKKSRGGTKAKIAGTWEQSTGEKKMLRWDPSTHKYMSHEEYQTAMSTTFDRGREQGYNAGLQAGRIEAGQKAFSDLAEVWTEVAKALAISNAYARSIAGMYRAQSGESTGEKDETRDLRQHQASG